MPHKTRVPRSCSATLGSPFGFSSKTEFNASKDLIRSRSECSLESKRTRNRQEKNELLDKTTVWDIRPPDFTLQLYQPSPPKRNTRESMIQGYDEDEWNKAVREKNRDKIEYERISLPKILQPRAHEKLPFVTRFRIPDIHASKLWFVKEGVYYPGPYTTPGPNAFRGDDFRRLECPKKLGKPEFVTFSEHDPGNLKFKTRTLNVLHEGYKDPLMHQQDGYRKQMVTFQEQDPTWENSLQLVKGEYKKGRSPHSALMHRIEKQLPWCSQRDKIGHISRPDIFDHKTVDWLAVTLHDKDEATRI